MTSHASRKTKHFPPRWWNPLLILTLPTVALSQLAPSLLQAQRILPHTRWEPLGKRAIVSWEGLRLDGCGETWGFGIPSQPIPPGKPSWKEDLCKRASPECHGEISLNVPSRGNCIPKGVASPQIRFLDSNTTPPKASPLLSCLLWKERPARVKHGAALEHGGFFVVSFLKVFHLPTFFVPVVCPRPHPMTPGRLRLHTTLPVCLEPGCRKGFLFVEPSSGKQDAKEAT